MEGSKTISKIIPEGELNCIWAEAGMVSYKLCDRNFECDECPFDQVMRQKMKPASVIHSSVTKKEDAAKSEKKDLSRQESLLDLIRSIFNAPFERKPPSDRKYFLNHVWVKKVLESTYRIGLDHYAADLMAGIGDVVLPHTGTSAVKNNPCAWLICNGDTIPLHSPFNGRITDVNLRLAGSPSLLTKDPYEAGWLNEIYSEEIFPGDLMDSTDIETASTRQFRAVRQEVVADFDNSPASLGVTLMDGGSRPRNLRDILGMAKYLALMQKLLSIKPIT